MTALNFSEDKFTHRQQIIQLLQLAIDKRWCFTYMIIEGKKVTSHPVTLLSLNVDNGSLVIDRDLVAEGCNTTGPVMLRGQCGGLSILFQTLIRESRSTQFNGLTKPVHEIDLPYEVRCTQLRNNQRISLEAEGEQWPVTLYLAMGYKLEGSLVDISVSGAGIRLAGDHSERLNNLQILEARRIDLPGDFVLRSGAQLAGVDYVEGEDASLVHCQFGEMADEDEIKLGSFISKVISNNSSLAPA